MAADLGAGGCCVGAVKDLVLSRLTLSLVSGFQWQGCVCVSFPYLLRYKWTFFFGFFFRFCLVLKVHGALRRRANILMYSIFRQNKIRLCMDKCSYELEMILMYEKRCIEAYSYVFILICSLEIEHRTYVRACVCVTRV